MTDARSNLQFLCEPAHNPPKLLIVSPHPDDEIIGAGSRLPLLHNAVVVQVTNGAPAEMKDALAAGYESRDSYAQARHRELLDALALCGLHETIELHIPDQGAAFRLTSLTQRLKDIIAQFGPDYVLTVPYEGGHPDHDATAFAVHQACRHGGPQIIEMLSYHNCHGRCVMDQFLDETNEILRIQLSNQEISFKRQLMDCFRSQAGVLQWFPVELEKFRFAPDYNFTQPPHQGPLYYELFPWGLNFTRWAELAEHALHDELLPA